MTNVADANIIILIVALLVGLIVGWWIFKSRRATDSDRHLGEAKRDKVVEAPRPEPRIAPVAPPTTGDLHEGNGIADQGAAATSDVAGQLLDAPVHSELPGASGPPDNLEILKGVGPRLAVKLNESGITRFEQLARLSPNEVSILEDGLGPFKGRLVRDRVVEQAQYLARGDKDGFEARFGKLGGA